MNIYTKCVCVCVFSTPNFTESLETIIIIIIIFKLLHACILTTSISLIINEWRLVREDFEIASLHKKFHDLLMYNNLLKN